MIVYDSCLRYLSKIGLIHTALLPLQRWGRIPVGGVGWGGGGGGCGGGVVVVLSHICIETNSNWLC